MRSQLEQRALPTSAEDVRVRVVGEEGGAGLASVGHGAAVTRTIAGPVGLARGADIGLS